MGNKFAKHMAKIRQQKVNKQENRLYYQNGTAQKSPRTETKISQDRKLQP